MTSSLEFDEATHVERDKPKDIQQSQRTMFMNSVLRDIANQPPWKEIWKMSLTMSRPHEYAHGINEFILFSVYLGVKHLEFNFDDPNWEQNDAVSFHLPDGVYQQNENLEYLKLRCCNLDFTRFASLKFLKTISLSYTIITSNELRYVVASCPILETLRLERCVGMNWLWISEPNSMLKNLVFDHCLNNYFVEIDGPKLRMFEYSGKVMQILIKNPNELIEVRLDFSMQDKFDSLGFHLFNLMGQLMAVRSLTVCSAFLQIISTEKLSIDARLGLNVRHLTMNTALHATEFIGIRFMLRSCPRMNTLTLCIVPRKIFDDYVALYPINPTYYCWTPEAETCLLQSLEVLNVRGFEGLPDEMCFIRYIIYFGLRLQRVNLFPVAVQEDDHAKREELESKCNLLMQAPRANPLLEILRG